MAKSVAAVEPLVFELERALVVRAAEGAVRSARAQGVPVSTGLTRRLFRVAREAREFAIGDWWINDRCGCLVGNLLGGPPTDVEDLSEDLYWVGIQFDSHLVARLPQEMLEQHLDAACSSRRRRPEIVRVVG